MADQKLITSLATPIAIVVAGVFIAGAVLYKDKLLGTSSDPKVAGANTTTTTTGGLGSKYQKFIDLAGQVSLDTKKFSACMDKFDTAGIKADAAEAAKYGAQGTPAFFIGKTDGDKTNGVFVPGAYPFETFKGIIDGIQEGDDKKILEAVGPDQNGKAPTDVASISKEVSFGNGAVKGNKDAPITIVEFSDYECPFCQRHVQTTYPDLVKNYIDTGKVKLVFRNLPLSFHEPVASQAAVAANCAREQGGDEAYFKYHDEYYSRTQANGKGLI